MLCDRVNFEEVRSTCLVLEVALILNYFRKASYFSLILVDRLSCRANNDVLRMVVHGVSNREKTQIASIPIFPERRTVWDAVAQSQSQISPHPAISPTNHSNSNNRIGSR
jgi:hypothetical protein